MMGMNELEPVLFAQFDNDFLIGIAYDPKNTIDLFSRNRRRKRFEYLHGDFLLIGATAPIAKQTRVKCVERPLHGGPRC